MCISFILFTRQSTQNTGTTIIFQYIYLIAFWLIENSTTLPAPKKSTDSTILAYDLN